MARTHGLHWNAVPWYVGDGKRNAGVTGHQVERGRRYLARLLDLAPSVRVVVALGRPAQRCVAGATELLSGRGVQVIRAPHPSPIPAGLTGGRSLREVEAAFREALRLAGN
jgi:uracil-DNA glycosylase